MLDGLTIADTIETQRIRLRPPRPRDAAMIAMYLGDERVARSLIMIPHPFPPGAAEAMVERALEGRRQGPLYVMDASPSDGPEVIGLVFVNRDRAEDGAYRIAYMVGPAFRDTGYATEAAEAVTGHLLEAGARAVTATVFQDNAPSAQVLTHVGFAYTGDEDVHSVARGGVAPAWRYRMDAERWRARS